MRSIWKGHIRFSLVTIPIRIYNAVDTAQTIRFNQLHKECSGRVGYDKKCKKCLEVV
ncbi:MAG: Ku protein, partial [Gemmatimonadetes bacterium]|nr:Ku protein [Gemmatimonadota bacterium]